MTALARAEIDRVDWSQFASHYGPADDVGEALRDLLGSDDFDSAARAWERLEDHVFSQGTIYSSAEPTIAVLLAALTEHQPNWRSGRIADLLFFIVSGGSTAEPTLQRRCHERAREGFWLLVSRAAESDGWARDNLLEVIDVIAPERAPLVRAVLSEDRS